ncbi:MAG: biotin/lipoyl-containing protein, partial [Myxococcota bacterium]
THAAAAYLDHDAVFDALRRLEADAVWPGWGFVAEDAGFVERVLEAGMRFLGPSPDVMRAVGDKIGSKHAAESAGVPVVPWSGGELRDVETAREHAARIGYPVVLKASAGGGGRGIRVVTREEDLAAAFASAKAEARGAFGDERLFVERMLRRGRHVEVQIAADAHGLALSLGCRDCSVQRRHQKILEEAPPPGLPDALVASLEAHAVRLAETVGYVGVGTVEFLVSGGDVAFLEVNPRLQVEHGITEELTGVDLVALQIRIARGESIADVADVPRRGAAIEARICAEDPEADFLPAPGRIARFDPALGPRLRVDTGVVAGARVPPDFDSLIAKVIASGDTREEARARLVSGLVDFELLVEGGASNKGYLIDLLETDTYRRGEADTEWLDRSPELRGGSDVHAVPALVAAAILSYQRSRDAARRAFMADPSHIAPSQIPASDGQRIDLSRGGESYRLEVFAIGAWRYRVHLDGRVVQVSLRSEGSGRGVLEMAGASLRTLHDANERGLRVEVEGRPYRFGSELAGQVRAGTPALVVALSVQAGDVVQAGQPLGRLEAMKMEIGFDAPVAGTVKEIAVRAGQQVAAGELILSIEPAGDDAGRAAGERLVLPAAADPLDLFTRAGDDETPDLGRAGQAPEPERRRAIEAARDEIRRVLMGYDVNPARGEKLAAFLEAPLPDGLSDTFRWELAEVRHELSLFADLARVFSRAPRPGNGSGPGRSNHAQLRDFVRRVETGDAVVSDAFREVLTAAVAHYGLHDLAPSDGLERAVLRLLASQHEPDLRRRLVLGCIRRVHALARSGLHLGDDRRMDEAMTRIATLRPLVSDAVADAALEAGYAIFEGPLLQSEAERTSKEVEAWLAAAEADVQEPPAAVLTHLASAPRAVFDRVGRWLEDDDPRRRSVALAAHARRLYAPARPAAHTSGVIGPVHVERLDFPDGRIVVSGVARREQLAPTVERLSRAAAAAPAPAPRPRAHA